MTGAKLPERPEPPDPKSALEAASYIADLTREMSGLARRSGFDVLAYMFQIARLEAEEIIHNLKSNRRG